MVHIYRPKEQAVCVIVELRHLDRWIHEAFVVDIQAKVSVVKGPQGFQDQFPQCQCQRVDLRDILVPEGGGYLLA